LRALAGRRRLAAASLDLGHVGDGESTVLRDGGIGPVDRDRGERQESIIVVDAIRPALHAGLILDAALDLTGDRRVDGRVRCESVVAEHRISQTVPIESDFESVEEHTHFPSIWPLGQLFFASLTSHQVLVFAAGSWAASLPAAPNRTPRMQNIDKVRMETLSLKNQFSSSPSASTETRLRGLVLSRPETETKGRTRFGC
jgi:hypothetical protein